MERWWDGTAWTEYTRTAPVPADAPQAFPGYVGYQGYPQPPVPERGRRTGTVVLALVGSLVLIGGIVAGVLVLGSDDGDGKPDAAPTAPPSHHGKIPGPAPTDGDSGGGSGGGSDGGGSGGSGGDKGGDGKTAVDSYDAVSLPVLDGWKGESMDTGASVTTGDYTCPGSGGDGCTLAGVFTMPAIGVGIATSDPEEAAKLDISKNAAASYGPDTYGATTSHQQVKAGKVTVAGQQGYLVRWKVDTKSGTKGYVESLAFTSPTTHQLVLVRFGFDITAEAPGVDVMDQITAGIKLDTSHRSGGTGTGV
jgi:hypothetical protein